MIQHGDGAGFGFEAVVELLRRDFDGDFAAETRIARPLHLAHAALANKRDQLIGLTCIGVGVDIRFDRFYRMHSDSGRTVCKYGHWADTTLWETPRVLPGGL